MRQTVRHEKCDAEACLIGPECFAQLAASIRVGSVDDIIFTTDKAVSYAFVNANSFLAVAKHNIAIPVSQFQLNGDKLVLPGATRYSLKAAPEFEYPN